MPISESVNITDTHAHLDYPDLRACRLEHGLLINFGGPKLEIKKYALSI